MAKRKPGELNNLIGGQIEDSRKPSILSNRIRLWLPPHVFVRSKHAQDTYLTRTKQPAERTPNCLDKTSWKDCFVVH